jgi:hypothetical protein
MCYMFCLQGLHGPPQAIRDTLHVCVVGCTCLCLCLDVTFKKNMFFSGREQGNSLARTCSTSSAVPSISAMHCLPVLVLCVPAVATALCAAWSSAQLHLRAHRT